MVEQVTIGDATLYLGDCRDVLGGVRADLLVTDAPYKLTSGGVGKPSAEHIPMRGKFGADEYDNDGEIVPCDLEWSDWMGAAFAALADDADAYFMANDKHVAAAQAAALEAGFRFHNFLVWDKGAPTPNRWYMKCCEFTVYCWKGKARTIADPKAQQITKCPAPRGADAQHPTQKPVALMEEYIRQSSRPGDLVLDPFMGAGTTGVAALNLGRRFIGIEKKQKWFDVACTRLADAGNSPGLFYAAGGAS